MDGPGYGPGLEISARAQLYEEKLYTYFQSSGQKKHQSVFSTAAHPTIFSSEDVSSKNSLPITHTNFSVSFILPITVINLSLLSSTSPYCHQLLPTVSHGGGEIEYSGEEAGDRVEMLLTLGSR